MFASLVEVSLTDRQYVYEPKYDGIRALIAVESEIHGVDNGRNFVTRRISVFARYRSEEGIPLRSLPAY